MPHEVIMPALGMAQETGMLVAWHKAVGDKVTASDILMEVETDKSVVEVEAGFDGFIAELRAEAGTAVPVGDVIATIADQAGAVAAPEAAVAPKAVPAVAAEPAPTPVPAPAKAQTPPAVVVQPEQARAPAAEAGLLPSGRILASPKARRLAAEQGLDLGRLVASGLPQPYRVADLETLETMTVAAAPGSTTVATLGVAEVPREIDAQVSAEAFKRLCERLDDEGVAVPQKNAIWAAFAAAALREQTQAERVNVQVLQPATEMLSVYANPDQGRFSTLHPIDDGDVDLVLHDFSGSRITGIRGGAQDCPALSIVLVDNHYALNLVCTESQLPLVSALGLLDRFAARLEQPLHHLL